MSFYLLQKRTSDKNLLRDMAKQIDHDGFTPLIQACYQYKSWKVSNSVWNTWLICLVLHLCLCWCLVFLATLIYLLYTKF